MPNLFNSLSRWMGLDWENWTAAKRIGQSDALGLPPVFYAHNKIVGDIGQLPVDIKKNKGEGSSTDMNHPSYALLREQPNAMQAPSVFKEQVSSHAIMWGNGRAAIIRDKTGTPIELIPMMPDRTVTFIYEGVKYHATKPNKDEDTDMTLGFRTDKRGWVIMEDADVLHILGFAYNGIVGEGVMQMCNKALQIPYQAQNYEVNQLGKGFRGKLALETPPGMFRTEEEAKKFIDGFNKQEAGSDNAGKAALLREGIKLNSVNVTNNEAQFAQLKQFSRQDVGLMFGLESMPGDGDSVSYNSLEQKNQAYLVALDRWLIKWEEQCDMKLLSDVQKTRRSHYHKFNRASILRTDLATTMTAFTQAIAATIMSPNECRAKLDMNPYTGGDVYRNPNTTPATEQEDSPEDEQEDTQESESNDQSSLNARAAEETIRSLIKREANNAISASKKKNFVAWIDKNYKQWQSKLADKLESIGLDRQLSENHCNKSVEALIKIATSVDSEHLERAVTQEVQDWADRRVFQLMGITE